MDYENKRSRRQRLRKWFNKWKKKRPDPFHSNEVSDEDEDDDDPYLDYNCFRSSEIGSCILTNDLRVFVGTWNVAGRSPSGCLAVDLVDWLNLQNAADIYVLGFQEIVPLKASTVIGAEDPKAATKWNLLINKTLNNKFGRSTWSTPLLQRVSEDNYYCIGIPGSEKINNVGGMGTPIRVRSMLGQEESNGCSKYKLMASEKMVGVFISVWMKKDLLKKYSVSNVRVSSVACGIMGYLGNKGSVSVSLSIEGTSFCFIVAHLASGEKKGDKIRRNYQVSEIFRRTAFSRLSQQDENFHPQTILAHDRIFWFGDLNYRLCLEDCLARQLIKVQDWSALWWFDQLRREEVDGGVFQGWREGNIEFPPTYKYSSSNCNRYSGGLPGRPGEKQRTPAWCDRILWYGKGVKQLSYFRSESKFSDHRPVSALFSIQIEFVESSTPAVAAVTTILPAIGRPKPTDHEEGVDNAKSTLVSLLVQDMEASPTKDTTTMTS